MNAELPVEIDVQSVQQLLGSGEKLLLVDVREPDEYDTARIAAARLIPMRQIPESLAQLEEHRAGRIVVHCHHGGRSLRVVQWLRQKGYPNVQNMSGGIDAWSQQIDPSVPRY
jgi:rhodanese-related sulfurtransferase